MQISEKEYKRALKEAKYYKKFTKGKFKVDYPYEYMMLEYYHNIVMEYRKQKIFMSQSEYFKEVRT